MNIPDPRPDLPGYELWLKVFNLAWVEDGTDPNGLYGMFHGLRCIGAKLKEGPERLTVSKGDIGGDEWTRIVGTWLEPRRSEIVKLLTVAHVPELVKETL